MGLFSVQCGLIFHLKVGVRNGENPLISSLCFRLSSTGVGGICSRLGLKCAVKS